MTTTRIGYAGLALIAMVISQPGTVRALRTQAPAAQTASRAERTTWYFYRVKWGYQDEFVNLFQKNHYPILKEQLKAGRLTDLRTYVPTYHGDGRADWTFAVSLTYRDAVTMVTPGNDEEIARRLFPDQATFRKEEQRRFEILAGHWDVPIKSVELEAK